MKLQQGLGINGMGQRDPFAARQFLAVHVRLKRTLTNAWAMSALPPKADMVTLMLCLGYTLAISVAERQYLRRCQHDLLVANAWIAD
jgi:hypothetical protein